MNLWPRTPIQSRRTLRARVAALETQAQSLRLDFAVLELEVYAHLDFPPVEHAHCTPAICIEVDASDPAQFDCPLWLTHDAEASR